MNKLLTTQSRLTSFIKKKLAIIMMRKLEICCWCHSLAHQPGVINYICITLFFYKRSTRNYKFTQKSELVFQKEREEREDRCKYIDRYIDRRKEIRQREREGRTRRERKRESREREGGRNREGERKRGERGETKRRRREREKEKEGKRGGRTYTKTPLVQINHQVQ